MPSIPSHGRDVGIRIRLAFALVIAADDGAGADDPEEPGDIPLSVSIVARGPVERDHSLDGDPGLSRSGQLRPTS